MPAESNVSGMARALYLAGGATFCMWGLWGADHGWTQWTWLAIGGSLLVLGLIGYSPVHAILADKQKKAG
jgi:hypothetical protein